MNEKSFFDNIKAAIALGCAIAVLLATTIVFAVYAAVFGFSKSTASSPPEGIAQGSESDDAAKGLINPDREERGVWIASVLNINFPSKQGLSADALRAELDDIVKTVEDANLNSIYFQVRPSCDALYKSDIFPVSKYLTGKYGASLPSGFDPLEYLIKIAHERDITVHAWVNPLRVTAGAKETLSDLPESSPARLHADYVVEYGGKYYFDAGKPEVRELVAAGVAEIVRNYDVDGVCFDDYFYPYPQSGVTFDDGDTYKKYGAGYSSIADFRRDSVNLLIKECHDAVKAENSLCAFGVAPAGIWQNDDGKNGGSDTRGMESYNSIYCDPLAWAKAGSVDYIAPQIYWQFTTSVARYDTLVKWWNAALSEYGVRFYVCHAAYRVGEWKSDTEIPQQVEFARSEKAYRGSIMYGYAAIKGNEYSLKDKLRSLFADEIIYMDVVSDGSEVSFNSPKNGATLTSDNTYILGKCDPGYPLYLDGRPVSVTKSGFFSVYVSLKNGTNSFKFTQNGKETVFTVTRTSGATGVSYATMPDFTIAAASPSSETILARGDTLNVSVTAPAGSRVTATLAGKTYTLSPTINPHGGAKYYKEIYTAKITPDAAATSGIRDLGKIVFTASKGSLKASRTGANVSVLGDGKTLRVTVTGSEAALKPAPSSSYYDSHTRQAKGMTADAVSLQNGYFLLRCGAYLDASACKYDAEGKVGTGKLEGVKIFSDGKNTKIVISSTTAAPTVAKLDGKTFKVTVLNCKKAANFSISTDRNPLFESASASESGENIEIECALIDNLNFYGYHVENEDGKIVVVLRNPSGLADKDKPLLGKTIHLDAGHGGSDTGAPCPDAAATEKVLNLAVTLALRDKLVALGATVAMTREDDSTVVLTDRAELLDDTTPDLSLSIHQNSIDYSANVTRIRGLTTLYFADGGRLLAERVSHAASSSLNFYEWNVTRSRLAMVRNYKFPSALVEVSFTTCVEEYEKMRSERGIEEAAEGLARGILDYFEAQEKYISQK